MNVTPIQQEVIKKIFQAPLGIARIASMTEQEQLALNHLDAMKMVFKQAIMTHHGLVRVATLRRSGLEAYEALEG